MRILYPAMETNQQQTQSKRPGIQARLRQIQRQLYELTAEVQDITDTLFGEEQSPSPIDFSLLLSGLQLRRMSTLSPEELSKLKLQCSQMAPTVEKHTQHIQPDKSTIPIDFSKVTTPVKKKKVFLKDPPTPGTMERIQGQAVHGQRASDVV
jgi:hypothetical protein